MAQVTHSKLTANRPWIFRARWRLFLALFLGLAIPTAILTAITAFYVSKELTAQTLRQSTVTARLIAKHLDEEFFGLRRYIESFATRHTVISALQQKNYAVVQDQIIDAVEQNKKVSRAALTDPRGVLLLDYPTDKSVIGKNFSHRDWFKGASRSDRPYVSGIYERAALDHAVVVAVATKVKAEDDTVFGYLVSQYTIDDLMEWLESVQGSHSERVVIFDRFGAQVTTPSTSIQSIGRHPDIQKLLKREEGSVRVNNLGGFDRAIVSHIAVPELDWTVIVYQDEKVIFAPVKRLMGTILLFFLIAVTAMSVLGWLWNRVLFAYAEDLRRSNKELENFCYSIAHDLRSPLRAMEGFTSVIADEYGDRLDNEGRECARRIKTSAERMDSLIRDLLEYGSLAHRNLEFEKINLDTAVQKSIATMSIWLQERGAEVSVRSPLGTVSADSYMLNRMLEQLLSNAAKYVAPGIKPTVELWSDQKENVVRLWIQDNGIGIPPNQHDRIFGVFQRLHGSDQYSGTGIGLAIVKKAAERMGGSAGVESEPGKGSGFWIELPRK